MNLKQTKIDYASLERHLRDVDNKIMKLKSAQGQINQEVLLTLRNSWEGEAYSHYERELLQLSQELGSLIKAYESISSKASKCAIDYRKADENAIRVI